jgi:YidC/Oxa1 family membrane protein insertase
MDKNTIIGTVLIALLFIGYMFYSSQQQEPAGEETTESTEQVDEVIIEDDVTSNVSGDTTGLVVAADTSTTDSTQSTPETQKPKSIAGVFPIPEDFDEGNQIIENDEIILEVSPKGASIVRIQLKEYDGHDGKPVVLADEQSWNQDFIFPVKEDPSAYEISNVHTAELPFVLESADDKELIFRCYASNGGYLEKSFRLGDGFIMDMDLRFYNLNVYADNLSSAIELDWSNKTIPQESNLENERRYSSIYYRSGGDDVDNLNLNKPDEEEVAARMDWVAFKQQFFNTTMIYDQGFTSGEMRVDFNEDEEGYVKNFHSHLYLDYKNGQQDQSFRFSFFLGPNHYQTLKKLDRDMEELVQLSADFFLFGWVKYINRWVIIPLFNFLEGYIANYGIIILIMTLLIKFVLSPLTFKSYKSQAMLKILKPELDELKEKYKDDQQKFGTEQWKLYQKAGVSPFSGCVPMLLQFPILIAMFYFFPGSIELRQEAFLWANDLSTYDDLISFSTTIPFIGNHISLFTILMTVTSLITALTNSQMNQAGAQGALKYMPYFFPIFLFFIFNNFPAALTYYYFLSNVISIGQQYAIKAFFIDEDKLHEQIQKNKAKPKKKGGFAARLEEAYKVQQQRSEEMKKQQGGRRDRRKK